MADDSKAPEKDDAAGSLKRKADEAAEGDAEAAGERRAAAPAAGFSGFSAAKSGFAAFASAGTSAFGGAAATGGGFGSAGGGFGSVSGGFGSQTGGGFGSVGGGFGSTGGGFGNSLFPAFGAAGGSGKIFGSSSAAVGSKEGDEDDENNGAGSPPPPEPSYTPVVSLSEQEKVTGEEDEVPVCQAAGTLFAFESPDGVKPSAWKERGRGDLHVNLNKAGSAARLVMRAKGNLRLILNAKIFPGMSIKEMDGGKGVTFACVNAADQGEDASASLRTFALRLGGKDASEKVAFLMGKLKETHDKVAEAEKAGNGEGKKEADAAPSGEEKKGAEAV